MIKLSIIIPVCNEEESLEELFSELIPVLQGMRVSYEIICIDDGSTDRSPAVLKKLHKKNKHIRIIQFDRNYGKSSALDAAFSEVRGEWVITMDADLQDDPADIPAFYTAAQKADIVCGIRTRRQDSIIRRISSRLANWWRNRILHESIKDTGCGFKCIRTSLLQKIKMFQGMHRFFPSLIEMEGGRIAQIPVHHRHRKYGSAKYGVWNRVFRASRDLRAVRWMKDRNIVYHIKKNY